MCYFYLKMPNVESYFMNTKYFLLHIAHTLAIIMFLAIELLMCCFVFLALAAIVSVNGPPYLCKTDEVGEICVSCYGTATSYWGLQGLTNTIFKVSLHLKDIF